MQIIIDKQVNKDGIQINTMTNKWLICCPNGIFRSKILGDFTELGRSPMQGKLPSLQGWPELRLLAAMNL